MTTPCTYADRRIVRVSGVSGDSASDATTICLLKERSFDAKVAISGNHAAKGIGGSIMGITCPVAVRGNWARCDWYKP